MVACFKFLWDNYFSLWQVLEASDSQDLDIGWGQKAHTSGSVRGLTVSSLLVSSLSCSPDSISEVDAVS